MTIEMAYDALAVAVAGALEGAGFLGGEALAIDPTVDLEPIDQGFGASTAAGLFQLETRPVRTVMGGPVPRHVVERLCRVELIVSAPSDDERRQLVILGRTALAALTGESGDPTLGGACERLSLGVLSAEDLAAAGAADVVDFILRVRSGDPLGLTP